ncbi:MAG: GNAT family N-acetyltransferase [Thermoplasmata archaeon]
MELNNIKLDWNIILEPYISYLEKEYKSTSVREKMQPIIGRLMENRIKSRVVISGGKVACYGFFMEPEMFSDRVYGNIGFVSAETWSVQRLDTVLSWIVTESEHMGKIPFIQDIFNRGPEADDFLGSKGFRKLERVKMELDLGTFNQIPKEIAGDFIFSGLEDIDITEFSDAEYLSYRDTPDSVMFGTRRDERLKLTGALFTEDLYGKVDYSSSLLCRKGGDLAGAIVVAESSDEAGKTGGFILTIFVKPNYRKTGLGKALLLKSLNEMKQSGKNSAILWVTESNEAKVMYENVGFRKSETMKEVLYFKNVV